jgi:hypothetical protein
MDLYSKRIEKWEDIINNKSRIEWIYDNYFDALPIALDHLSGCQNIPRGWQKVIAELLYISMLYLSSLPHYMLTKHQKELQDLINIIKYGEIKYQYRICIFLHTYGYTALYIIHNIINPNETIMGLNMKDKPTTGKIILETNIMQCPYYDINSDCIIFVLVDRIVYYKCSSPDIISDFLPCVDERHLLLMHIEGDQLMKLPEHCDTNLGAIKSCRTCYGHSHGVCESCGAYYCSNECVSHIFTHDSNCSSRSSLSSRSSHSSHYD